MKVKAAYQGIRGAYSEDAIYKHFGKDAESVGYETFEDVFDSVKKCKATHGIIPFENSIAGNIAANYDLLLKEDVFVTAEVFLKVRHFLLGHKGSGLKEIKSVYSHSQALQPCRDFLRKKKIKVIQEYDTAGAALLLGKRGKEAAAIASEHCAEIYKLDILAKDIQSSMSNTTRFLVFVKKENIPEGLKKEKTSIVFKTKHYPNALVNCLQRLGKNGINLTKLESRPIPENPWEYMFFVDFEGGIDNENVKLALSEMEASATFIKVIGSYPKGRD